MVSFVPPSSLNTAILLHATRNKQVVCCVLVGRSGRRATGPLSNTSSQGRNERLSYPQPLSASLTPARHNSISQPLRRRNKQRHMPQLGLSPPCTWLANHGSNLPCGRDSRPKLRTAGAGQRSLARRGTGRGAPCWRSKRVRGGRGTAPSDHGQLHERGKQPSEQ